MRMETGPVSHDTLGPSEATFIAARDSFYMATVSETGWPYVQHRGGPPGFLKMLDEHRLGFADYRGNRQFISLGNLAGDDRVAIILMDYPNRRRLKLLGRMEPVSLADDPALARALAVEGYPVVPERAFVVHIAAFDWNCPQHITPRFTDAEVAAAMAAFRERLEQLEAENSALRAALQTQSTGASA